jgi:CubicO group peptidase (beta-lactamase class C family)
MERLVAEIHASIAKQDKNQPFSGVIWVQKAGIPIFARAYGYANRAERIPNRLDTRFPIASGSKIFTGVAICQLVDRSPR